MNSERSYRRLFFIKFLHVFFLDRPEKRYFKLTSAEIDERLRSAVVNGQYRVMDDLIIQPSEETKALLKGHRLVYKVLPHGLLVGTAIQQETVDGVVKTKPAIPLNKKLRLQFYISAKNSFKVYSSTRLDPVIPAAYYFTNDNKTAGIKYPSLSVPIKSFTDGQCYQMGETAIVNGTAQQAEFTTRKALLGWEKFDFANIQCINEYDRILINKKFTYSFESAGIQEAKFELRQNGQVIKTIEVSQQKPFSNVFIDVEKKDDNKTLIEDGKYQLKVSGSDNYIWESEIYLNNSFYAPRRWGVLDIAMQTEDPAFTILDEEGYLAGQDEFTYPTMELRILNRFTYWKYFFQYKGPSGSTGKDWLAVSPTPPGMDKVIISKHPRPLMKAFQEIKFDSDSALLPNPSEQRLGKENDKKQGLKICSEILLTKIKL